MPGLLQTPDSKFGSLKFLYALIAEFLGTLIFAWAGSATPAGVTSTQTSTATDNSFSSNWAPWGNGMTLAIMVFFTANVSGGHLNPAVTAGSTRIMAIMTASTYGKHARALFILPMYSATMVTGHITILKGIGYIIAQLFGAICGLLLLTGLVPGAQIGMGGAGPGCFKAGTDIGKAQLFGWELVMTFVLVSVVYAVAIGKPSFGVVGPFAVGLALFAMVFAGSQYTGTAINPARALGPAAVYHCYWDQVWVYALGEFSGGIIAGIIAAPLYGVGSKWLQVLMPFAATKDEVEGKPADDDEDDGQQVEDGHKPGDKTGRKQSYPKFFQSRPNGENAAQPRSRTAPDRPILDSHNTAQMQEANRPGAMV